MSNALIIGAGLGGLSTSIHLRLAGFDVTVLEQNSQAGGRANRLTMNGFTFDAGPSLLNYPWVFEELFALAGRNLYDYLELIEVEPGIRFYWPDGESLQLSSRFDLLRSELERFDPGVGPRLARWLDRAGRNYRLSFERLVISNTDSPLKWLGALKLNELAGLGLEKPLYRQLSTTFHSRRICQAMGSYAMYLGGSPFDLPGLFEILPFGEINYGLWLPRGGIYALVEAMVDLASDLGVEFRTNCRVEQVTQDGVRAAGVLLADGERLAAEATVSNCDLPYTDVNLLPEGLAKSTGVRRAGRLAMTPGVMTFYWGLNREIQGLGHHSIFLPDNYRQSFNDLMTGSGISSNPPFYTSVASASDPQLAPAGKSTLFVLVPTPVLSRLDRTDFLAESERLKQLVFSRLRGHGCNISAGDIEVERVLTPRDWRNSFSLYDGSAFGAAHSLFMLGPWRPANRNPHLPGMFYVGASTTPGTGMPLVTLGGRMTAERVVEYVR